jgi:hypothetical protein
MKVKEIKKEIKGDNRCAQRALAKNVERARNSLASSLSWSFHSNKMSLPGTGILKKMLIYDDQSQYVYENKRNMHKMTAEESDIYGDMTWILQKNSGYDGTIHLE